MKTHYGATVAFLLISADLLWTKTRDETDSIFINGDFIIGALFPVHHQPPNNFKYTSSIKCGSIRELYGIQRVEAALYTLDKINKDPKLLPNLELGIEIRDECWYAPVALQQTIELIRESISPSSDYPACAQLPNAPQETPKYNKDSRGPLIGVIGPGSSSVALQVQNLLQLFQIPQVGYSTTSKDLSDKTRFNYFQRVVPSDYYQAQAILDIVRNHGWTYVSVVNTDENYGQSGIQAFRELAQESDVCIAQEDSVLSNAPAAHFDKVVLNLKQDTNARVVVCFCEGLTVRGLLMATRRLNLTNHFIFIGSDGWADRPDVTKDFDLEAYGSISIRIYAPYARQFDPYYWSLKPYSNTRNPWFKELWETKFFCNLNSSVLQNHGSKKKRKYPRLSEFKSSGRICSGEEELSEGYHQDPKLSFVIKSIYTLAHGLNNMHQEICGKNYVGICDKMIPFNGSLFRDYLAKVSFVYDYELISFDENADPPGKYHILNYQKMQDGTFNYVFVGTWNNHTLTWFGDLDYGPHDKVVSICAPPCPFGHYKNTQHSGKDKRCCWVCVKCSAGEILDTSNDNQSCLKCPKGTIPDQTQMVCQLLPIIYVKWLDTQALAALFLASLGFVTTSFSFISFVRYSNTPVVKSSTKELSYTILAGMMLAHASTFAILSEPSIIACGIKRLLPGLSFSMIYGAILTKTNRIARILTGSKKGFPSKKLFLMTAAAQVLITCFFIGIELFIAVAMLMYQHPDKSFTYLSTTTILECNTTPEGILVPLAFDFFLIFLCTVYAIKARNVPANFNEAKFIGFAMYTTCVIWIAFVPIYFSSDIKIITICTCINLSSMVIWIFLFVPKLYIIIFRPERNNRAFFTTSKNIRTHIGCRVSAALCETSSGNSWKDNACCKCKETAHKKLTPERRTLSCQTGVELMQVLLDPRHLLDTYSPLHSVVPRITERNCCETDSCQLKRITIKIPNKKQI